MAGVEEPKPTLPVAEIIPPSPQSSSHSTVSTPQVATPAPQSSSEKGKVLATPAVRKIAMENNVSCYFFACLKQKAKLLFARYI